MSEQHPGVVWQDKIDHYGISPLDQILANPANWKIHSRYAQDALEGSLDDLGILKPLIINLRTSPQWPPGDQGVETLLDGHRRVVVGLRRGQPTWPTVWVDLTPAEEAEALLVLDETTALRSADREKLDALLREVSSGNGAVQQLLGELAENHGLYTAPPASLEALEEQYGEEDPQAFWKTIMLKVPPETFQQYQATLTQFPEATEAVAFAEILRRAVLSG